MEIELERLTYQEIIDGKDIEKDDYGNFRTSLHPLRKEILMSNPNLNDKSVALGYLSRVDGVIIGHVYSYPIKFKAGDEIIDGAGGTSLGVEKDFEKYATGADLVMAPLRDKRNKVLIYADFSADGIALYKALRFVDFAIPKMIQPHSSKFIFENYGFRGVWLRAAYKITDLILKPYISFSMWRLSNFSNKYKVERLTTIPEWIDDMVLNDGHKYMEVHDHKWMQWCVDHCFFKYPTIQNYFYAIYDDNGSPLGFFLNKERTYDIPSRGISSMSFGTIMEWGSRDEKILSELDITKIAASYFSQDIGAIQYCSNNITVLNTMRKFGFLHHNYHHIVFKDLTKKLKDAKEPNLWRLRFGYSDSIMN